VDACLRPLWLRHGTVAEAADLQLPPGAVTVGWLHTTRATATSASIQIGINDTHEGIGRQPAVQVEGEQ
jgi:hypothetical protein